MTPLDACVIHLSARLERPVLAADLAEPLPDADPDAPVAAEDVAANLRRAVICCERAGLAAYFGKRAAARITAQLLPAILPLKNGHAVVLNDLQGDRAVVFDPDQPEAVVTVPKADLVAQWTGYLLTLKPDPTRNPLASHSGDTVSQHWFWGPLQANRWAYIQVALAAATSNILTLVASLFTMVVYDRILPTGATSSLVALTLGVGLAVLFDLIVKTLRAAFIDQAGHRADLQMGQSIYNHVLDIEQKARRGSVGSVSATLREFESLRDFFTSATMVALVDLPFTVVFLLAIWLLAGPLAIVALISVPLVIGVGLAVLPWLSRLSDKILTEGQVKQAVLVETLSGIETIKATGAAPKMRARYAESLARQSDFAIDSRAATQLAINLTGFIQQAAQILVVVYGAALVIGGEISAGVLIAAVMLTGRALAPLSLIAQTLTRLHQARSSYRSLDALMRTPTETRARHSAVARPILSGGLRFDKVRFAYPGQRGQALEEVSFTIQPGERVALLGPTGSGKSTVARLALGLYAPDDGVVYADGIDLRQIDPADLRRNIGAVLQDPWLVSGTLKENIALGVKRPTDDAILAAARLAGVEDFAARHPDGYAMPIAERGEGLSGGQRQAVAMARAFLAEPALFIMDEPTSAMDTQSEAALIARMKPALSGRTLVLVTHRHSLLDLVDRVIVLDGGRVVADGPKSILQRRAGAA